MCVIKLFCMQQILSKLLLNYFVRNRPKSDISDVNVVNIRVRIGLCHAWYILSAPNGRGNMHEIKLFSTKFRDLRGN